MNTDLTPAPTPLTDAVINATRDERGVYDELDRMTALAKSLERELAGDRKEVIELYEQAHMEVEFCDSNEFSMTQEISSALSMLGQANKDLSGALREEQLKTQALLSALNEIHEENRNDIGPADNAHIDAIIRHTLSASLGTPG